MEILAFPFRLNNDGSAVRVLQGSEADAAQKVAAFVQTRAGELPLAPAYGLLDPAFRVLETGEINAGLAIYHPDIIVDGVSAFMTNTGKNVVEVVFNSGPTTTVTSNG
jgi:hypothetical protein